jgi:hypothetical protein
MDETMYKRMDPGDYGSKGEGSEGIFGETVEDLFDDLTLSPKTLCVENLIPKIIG